MVNLERYIQENISPKREFATIFGFSNSKNPQQNTSEDDIRGAFAATRCSGLNHILAQRLKKHSGVNFFRSVDFWQSMNDMNFQLITKIHALVRWHFSMQ